MKLSHLQKNLALLVGSTFFALLLAEGLVRIFAPQDLYSNASWYEANPIYRFRHRANLDRKMRWGEYYHLKTNSRGLREDHDIPYDPDHHWRVVIHGDSLTFGNGAEREVIFPVQAQNYLLSHGVANAEVINLAVSAHGPSLEYLYFKEEGVKYRPQVVVVAIYLGNDVVDEVRDQAFKLEGDQLVFQPYQIPFLKRLTDNFLYQFLADHSQLLILVRTAMTPHRAEQQAAYHAAAGFETKIAFALRVWLEFAREIEKTGAVPVFLLLPTREQIFAQEGIPLKDDPYKIAGPTREALLKTCGEKNFHCLDLLPLMADRLPDPNAAFIHEKDFYDFHYNQLGHALVGEELGKMLLTLAPSH